MNIHLSLFVNIGPEKPQWGVVNYIYIFIYLQNPMFYQSVCFIVFHHTTSGHFGWDGQKALFLFEEICDGVLCKAAESLEGEDCRKQVLLNCISLSICVLCCFYLLHVKSISWNKWRTLSDVLLGWNTPDKHSRTLEKCSSSCFAHFPRVLKCQLSFII